MAKNPTTRDEDEKREQGKIKLTPSVDEDTARLAIEKMSSLKKKTPSYKANIDPGTVTNVQTTFEGGTTFSAPGMERLGPNTAAYFYNTSLSGSSTAQKAFKNTYNANVKAAEKKKEEEEKKKKRQAAISAQMTALSGMTDLSGNAVDANTASLEEIIRAIKSDPDKGRRTAFVSALKELTKTEGSRFYGVEFDESAAKEFINSAALTQDSYDAQVERFAGRFNPLEGHEQENIDEYAYWVDKIENGGYTPYVKTAYRRALDAAYRQQTQKDELPDLTGYVPPQRESETPEEEKRSWLERLFLGMNIGGDDGEEAADAVSMPSPVPILSPSPAPDTTASVEPIEPENTQEPAEEETQEPTPAPEPTPTPTPKAEKEAETQGPQQRKPPSLQDAIDEGWETPEKQGPIQQEAEATETPYPTLSEAMSDMEFAAAYDEAQRQQQAANASIPQGSVDLVNDPITAAAYMLDGKADLLTRETQEALDRLVMSSPGIRAILKLDVDATAQELEAAQSGDARAMIYVDGTRRYWATGDASAIIGSTLGSYLALSESDAFPQELRTAMQGALLEIVVDAEDAYERGEFEYDPKSGTLYDAYIRANPQVMQTVRGVKKAVSDMYLEQRRQEKLAADEAAMNEQALLEEHRAQVRSGTYTPEAYAHVIEKAPLVTIQTARADAVYREMAQEIDVDRTLSDGMEYSWHNQMADRYLRENGRPLDLGSAEAMLYKDSLAAYEKDVLLSDMRAAQTLGYGSLGEMYEAWGGMDIDKLHMRAEALMARDAKEATVQAGAILDEANSAYQGTGEGVWYTGAFAAGTAHGSLTAGSNMLEGIWSALSIVKEDMPSAVYNLRRTYTKAYGPALASTMYVKAMQEHMNDMSPEHADAIQAYIDAGYDPFRLGIDPLEGSVILDASNVLEGRAKSISDWAVKNLDKNKGKWFDVGSSTGSTVTMQTVATLGTMATGSGFVGTLLGYGLVGMNEETKSQLASGKSRKDALLMGGLRATSDTIANMITSDRFTQKTLGFLGYGPKVALGANAVGDVAASRSVLGMTKRYGAAFIKSAAQTSVEEVVIDEMTETLAWQMIGGAGETYISGANVFKAVAQGLGSIDVMEAVDETVKNAGVNFVSTLPLAILGGAGEMIGDARQAKSDPLRASRQAAVELAATGAPEAAEAFVQALASDLDNPAAVDQLNEELHDAAVSQEVSVALMTDEEVVPVIDEATKAQEQADAHAQSEENSRIAAQTGIDSAMSAQERMAGGEVSDTLVAQVSNGVEAHAKNTQSELEHRREKEQKQAEADKGFAQGFETAQKKAEAEVTRRETELRAATEVRRQIGEIEQQLAQVNREIREQLKKPFSKLSGKLASLRKERKALQDKFAALEGELDEAERREVAAFFDDGESVTGAAGEPAAETDNSRAAQVRRRIDQITAEFNERLAADPEALLDADTEAELEALFAEQIEAEEAAEAPVGEGDVADEAAHVPEIDKEAVAAQRAEAEAALARKDAEASEYLARQAEREKAQEEADAMLPVYQTLSRKEIYVDDTQRANILSRTGLKTLGQVNRKYGLRLTNDKKKNAPSLDGSTFAELYDLAPGYVAQDVTAVEDALMDIVERKKQLKGMQASVGETAYEQYLPDGAFYSIEDPVMQQLFSDVKKTTGVDIVVAPLANNVRALYDRAENRIVISNRIGTGEISRKVVMHELTHFIEGGDGYAQYKEAVLKAAYAHDEDGSQRAADEQRIFDTYRDAGYELDAEGLESELVAEATEKIITDPDGRLTRQLLGQKQKGLLYNLMVKLGQFMARKKAEKSGNLEQYDLIQNAYNRLKEALAQGRGDSTDADPTVDLDASGRRRGEMAHAGEDGQMQFALVDVGEMGKGVYESNFAPGTSKEEKQKRLIALWQNVWSQKPIELNIVEDGVIRQIVANFDPDYDITNVRKTDLGKVMTSRNGSGGDRTVTLNLADDLHDLARTSEYLVSEDETGKSTSTHQGVKKWHYFFNDIIYRDESGKDTPYTVWLDVKEKDDGGYVYQLYARKTKKRTAQSQPSDISRSTLTMPSPSDTSVAENAPDVNPYSMRDGQQFALAPNQFGNKTAQELTTIDESVKDILMGSRHEIVGNDERLDAAWRAVGERGADVVADELLSMEKGSWGAQENVNAALAAVLASRDGDVVTAATILTRYDREGTAQGQTLQARQLIKRLSPEGAMLEMIRAADRANKQKGVPAGSFPTGEDAPKKAISKKREDGGVERTHKKAAEVYHAADELKAELDKLPTDISYDNPWKLPLSEKQMGLIREFGLLGEKLPGVNYNVATKKQRMLAAILAMDPSCEGDGLTTLCQQLEAIDKGYAVVTMADLRYVASQMMEFRAKEGPDAAIPRTKEGAHALGRAYQALDNVKTANLLKKWTALRFANMLSAPATAVRNVAGNVIAGGLERASTAIAAAVDKGVAKETGTRTTARATAAERREADAAFRDEIIHTINDYFVDKVDTSYGRRYDVGGKGRVFQSEFLETYRNMVDFAMQIGDRPFFEQKYAEEKAIITRLGMKVTEATEDGTVITRAMTEQEIHEEATMRALHRVFQEDNAIVEWMNGLRSKSPFADLAVTTLMPFIKTPTNVAMRAIEYSPVGLGVTIGRKMFAGIDTGKLGSISQRDYVMGIGRGLTGTGLAAAGVALAASGMILRGREEEENQGRRDVRKSLLEPYGMYLKVGDQLREIDWAMPVASAIAVGADFFYALDDGEGLGQAAAGAIFGSVGGQILDTPMLSAMNDIFRGYDDAENIGYRLLNTGVDSLLNQTFSPSIIRAFAKATDPYVRDTASDSYLLEKVNKSVIQYWPGLRQALPKAYDVTGDAMRSGGYYSWGKENQNAALHFLDSFFTPTATIGEKNDDALFEILDLSYRTGETGFLPKTVVGSNGKLTITQKLAQATGTGAGSYQIELSSDERREFNRIYGDLLFNGMRNVRYDLPDGYTKRHKDAYRNLETGIRKMMENGTWARMDDAERMDAIDKMKSAAKELVSYMAIMDEL